MNAFNGLISRLDTAKERINEIKDESMESSQIEMERGKDGGKKHPRTVGQFQMCIIGITGIPEHKERE